MKIAAIIFLMLIIFSGCASAQNVYHSFSFDAFNESPDITILDWQYGQSNVSGTRARTEHPSQGTAVTGEMKIPDLLYVKWKDKSNGDIHERKIEIGRLLPVDMDRKEIHFTIIRKELYIYLITDEKRPQNWPIYPARHSKYNKTYQLFPQSR